MVRVTGLLPFAVVAGLGVGVGLWMLVGLMPRWRRPYLAARIAPYVIDLSMDARALLDRRTADPLPVFAVLLHPLSPRLRGGGAALLGGTEQLESRLRQAGLVTTAEAFRAKQLVWAVMGVAIAVTLALAIDSVQPLPVAAEVVAVLVVGLAGFIGREYLLQRAASARIARMTAELPTVLEFLTLSLSAGEGILDAIRRVARISRGELARELASVTYEVGSGITLAESLIGLSRGLQMPPLTRAIEQITGALERGTPLAEVLRAQAQDARDETKRRLLAVSGKKEVAMLVPLVFLILPVTIAIAIFPGLFVLQLGFD